MLEEATSERHGPPWRQASGHNTPAMMLKAMKRVNNPEDVVRVLEQLDQATSMYGGIWLNIVRETCTHTWRPAVLSKTSTTSPAIDARSMLLQDGAMVTGYIEKVKKGGWNKETCLEAVPRT